LAGVEWTVKDGVDITTECVEKGGDRKKEVERNREKEFSLKSSSRSR
jgi:hypothetical protein